MILYFVVEGGTTDREIPENLLKYGYIKIMEELGIEKKLGLLESFNLFKSKNQGQAWIKKVYEYRKNFEKLGFEVKIFVDNGMYSMFEKTWLLEAQGKVSEHLNFELQKYDLTLRDIYDFYFNYFPDFINSLYGLVDYYAIPDYYLWFDIKAWEELVDYCLDNIRVEPYIVYAKPDPKTEEHIEKVYYKAVEKGSHIAISSYRLKDLTPNSARKIKALISKSQNPLTHLFGTFELDVIMEFVAKTGVIPYSADASTWYNSVRFGYFQDWLYDISKLTLITKGSKNYRHIKAFELISADEKELLAKQFFIGLLYQNLVSEALNSMKNDLKEIEGGDKRWGEQDQEQEQEQDPDEDKL